MLIKKVRLPIKTILFVGLLPSFIKILLYKLKGYKIGKNVRIGFGSIIIGEKVEIGDHTKIGFLSVITANKIVIGRYTHIESLVFIDTETLEIGEDTRIKEQVYIGGIKKYNSMLKIGSRCMIMQGTYINPTQSILIGDDTGIGGNCHIFTHGSWLSILDGFPVNFEDVVIGKNVWIPWNVFILPGSIIGDNVVIGASSHISGIIPSNCLAAGNPAKVIIKKFPSVPNNETVNQIKQSIINEFILHLNSNDFICEKIINKKDIQLNISNKNKTKTYQIFWIEKINECNIISNDNLIIVDLINGKNDSMAFEINKKLKMFLMIDKKFRKGSSEIGDEFTRFISRYGIRFKRID